jgi:uncharacterized protein (DUF3820 family)
MMPFGKFKGVLIADIPEQYLQWCANSSFYNLHPQLQTAIAHELCNRSLRRLIALAKTTSPTTKLLLSEYVQKARTEGVTNPLLDELQAICEEDAELRSKIQL